MGVLNVKGFFDPLLAFVEHAVKEGFVQEMVRRCFACSTSCTTCPQYRNILIAESDPGALLDKLQAHQCPPSVVRKALQMRVAPVDDDKLFQ